MENLLMLELEACKEGNAFLRNKNCELQSKIDILSAENVELSNKVEELQEYNGRLRENSYEDEMENDYLKSQWENTANKLRRFSAGVIGKVKYLSMLNVGQIFEVTDNHIQNVLGIMLNNNKVDMIYWDTDSIIYELLEDISLKDIFMAEREVECYE